MIIRPGERRVEFGKMRKGELQKKGLSTGFPDMDKHLKLAKMYLAIISGYPSSGKSEWLDAVLVNMSVTYGWKTIYYSPENHPVEQHMGKLAEKFIGKHIMSFTQEDLNRSLVWLEEHFTWMYPENPELDTLLSLAEHEKQENGLDCLVIDPWNAVTHHRGASMVHEYLQEALTKLIRFARTHDLLAAIVAHPKTPQKDRDGNIPVPNLYDISDGAMWRNKADVGLIVHRPDMSRNACEVYVNKIKYKWMGLPGMVEFDYDFKTGRFKGKEEKEFLLPTELEAAF